MSETDGGLRSEFRRRIPDFHWQSIETGGVGNGVPDANYCGNFCEGWIENKQTDGWVVTLRPEQVAWLARRARAGGRVYVAVRRWHDGGPRKGASVDELWLLRGGAAVAIKQHGLVDEAEYVLGRWHGGPAAWDWSAVRKIISR